MSFPRTDTANDLKFERAQQKDADLLFKWINDASVRAQSLSNHIITHTEHTSWFSKKLEDKNCYLYIVHKNDKPVGMIRFDVNDDECMISYLVDAVQRGEGVGAEIINKGIKKFVNESTFRGVICATVKTSNPASIKIFKRQGFERENDNNDLIYFKKLVV